MPDEKPTLYDVEQQSEGVWAVIYTPEDTVHCYVPAREDCPPEDAEQRARMTADIMNGTVDMCSLDVRDLLEGYEDAYGHRHHADWRSE
jgi:hypothetical protein